MSNYIYALSPEKYGGQQDDFLVESQKLVDTAAEAFAKAVTGEKDLTALFHATMTSFAEARNKLAVKHKTAEAECFGKTRARDGAMTPLSNPYHEYNAQFLPKIQKHLSTLKHTFREFTERDFKVQHAKFLDRRSCFEGCILAPEYMAKLPKFNEAGYQKYCKLAGVAPKEGPDSDKFFNELRNNHEAMKKIKVASPEDYKLVKLATSIQHLYYRYYSQRKSDWVLMTRRLEINGKMYALSQYLTWMYRDYLEDPVDRMTRHAVVTVIHTDQFLIDELLQEISKVFAKALKWDKKDLKDLKNTVAEFEYLFAHAMPHERGSGAIAEWFERAIFKFHGYHLTYNQSKNVTFEVYISDFKEFVENYDQMIKLDKIAK